MLWKVLAILLVVTAGAVFFVERAMTSDEIRNIASIRTLDTQGGTVTVRGIVTYANENHIAIKDSTASADLVTCPVWYKRVSLFPGDEVTVTAQVLKQHSKAQNGDVVLGVYEVLCNGDEIEVRDKPGKPPWASASAAP